MPNWVTNELVVTGDAAQLKDFKDKFFTFVENKKVPTFNKIVPMPDEEKDNWYDWRVEHWGTKWDANYSEINAMASNMIDVRFDTAWSPPIEFFNTCADIYDKLRFECYFIDECNNFCGMFNIKGEEHEVQEGDVQYETDDGRRVIYTENGYVFADTNVKLTEDEWDNLGRINPFQ